MNYISKYQLCFYLILSLLTTSTIKAQQLDHVPGQLLIQTQKEMDMDRLLEQYSTFRRRATNISKVRSLQTIGSIHLIQFDQNTIHERALLRDLRRHPLVLAAQFNHLLSPRQTIPNDPAFNQQWFWVSSAMVTGAIDADLAWDISTGGSTPDGQDIVVAILDDGIDLDHPDLENSLWVNSNETPGNGIDDDGNGYIDDYRGWNINTDTDDVQTDAAGQGHGVTVAGMVGAVGNNSTGITGVNWSTHLMIVKNTAGVTQALALEAYAYPYTMRKLYNETDGDKGAFVVASNASWGLNFAHAEDAPIWCDFYNSLGEVGIINCTATTNLDINVDNDGDLPTTCPSDFLIAVTRTGMLQEHGGGFGPVNIDLGAPGIDIYSTEKEGNYGISTGTSLSSPLVAGMVAFLYSIPDNQLVALAKADPAAAALLSREYILKGVKMADGYEALVASGGIANLYNSAQKVVADATACLAPFGLKIVDRTDTEITLSWTPGNNAVDTELRWRMLGNSTWTMEGTVMPPFSVSGLSPCTQYEFQVAANCSSGNSGFSDSKVFSSDGCCTAPEGISLTDIGQNNISLSWESIFAALSYEVEIREDGIMDWTSVSVSGLSYTINDLSPCSNYELRIKTICTGISSEYSPIISFSTLGCGECQDAPYCEVQRNTEFEYIDRVIFAGVDNQSGDNGGYAGFFSLPMEVNAGETYEISLTPGYPGFNYTEDFEVWIDFNNDGDFDDVDEAVLFLENTSQVINGNITIPSGLVSSNTRMRVTIFFMGPSNPCAAQQEGETEDYCITISGSNNDCSPPNDLAVNVIDDFTVFLSWMAVDIANEYVISWREFGNTNWEEETSTEISYLLGNLKSCTEYNVRIRSACDSGNSAFSNSLDFKTKCETGINDPSEAFSFEVFPNPFQQQLYLSVNTSGSHQFEADLYDLNGVLVKSFGQFDISPGQQNILFTDIDFLNSGIYFLRIRNEGQTFVQKVVAVK